MEYLRHKLVVNAHLAPFTSHLLIDLNLRWQDRVGQYTDFQNTVHDYAPFCLVDGRITWQMPACQYYLEVNNLFNTKYVDYGHVPQPGTWLTAGIRYTL